MIIQIMDKLSLVNNSQESSEAEVLPQEPVESKFNEVLKYLTLLQVFAVNRLNLLCLQQIQSSDVLLELLKYFGNTIDNRTILQRVEYKLLQCLGLVLRNDKIGKQFIDTCRASNGIQYLINHAEEHLRVIQSNQKPHDTDHTFDLKILSAHLKVVR